MRALETIAHTIRVGKVHPTIVINTLIEIENEGGATALRQVERHLNRTEEALRDRAHPHSGLARAWLDATRAYLIAHAERRQAV
jgi:hypothetical protein